MATYENKITVHFTTSSKPFGAFFLSSDSTDPQESKYLQKTTKRYLLPQ